MRPSSKGVKMTDNKAKLKQEVQTIMNDALAGIVDIYRYEQDGQTYIRWGRVQRLAPAC